MRDDLTSYLRGGLAVEQRQSRPQNLPAAFTL
jgi:hypothetical protein